MFVLISSILLQVIKKLFGIIDKRGGGSGRGVQISIGLAGLEKYSKISKSGDVYFSLLFLMAALPSRILSSNNTLFP